MGIFFPSGNVKGDRAWTVLAGCNPKASSLLKMFCLREPGCRGLAVAQEQLEGHMLGRQMERVMEMIC